MNAKLDRKTIAQRLWRAGLTRLSKNDRKRLFLLLRGSRLAKDSHAEFETNKTFGQKLADRVAEFGGSWTFITIFGVILVASVFTNSWVLMNQAFDPYPYIF